MSSKRCANNAFRRSPNDGTGADGNAAVADAICSSASSVRNAGNKFADGTVNVHGTLCDASVSVYLPGLVDQHQQRDGPMLLMASVARGFFL